MKKIFSKFGGKNKGADGKSLSKASSDFTENVGPGYSVREKDLSKLHKAAWVGDLPKVKQYAKKDASPLDKEKRTPLHLACSRGHPAVVQELLEWRAKTNLGDLDGRTPLLKAAQCHQLQCVDLLLEHRADPNTQDSAGETCVHYAARDGVIMILERLLKCGNIGIDIKNKDGKTPMMIAVSAQQIRSIKLLLEDGADPDLQDLRGRTAIMLACLADDAQIVKLLLDGQASVTVKDQEGWTVFDIAEKSGNSSCLEVLRRHGGQIPTIPGGPMAQAAAMGGVEEEEEEDEDDQLPLDSWADSEDEPSITQEEKAQLKEEFAAQEAKKKEVMKKMRAFALGDEASDDDAKKSQPDPTSARSAASIGSIGSWSDDESLFSIGKDKNKPSLVKTGSTFSTFKPQMSKQEEEAESSPWDESHTRGAQSKPIPYAASSKDPAAYLNKSVTESDDYDDIEGIAEKMNALNSVQAASAQKSSAQKPTSIASTLGTDWDTSDDESSRLAQAKKRPIISKPVEIEEETAIPTEPAQMETSVLGVISPPPGFNNSFEALHGADGSNAVDQSDAVQEFVQWSDDEDEEPEWPDPPVFPEENVDRNTLSLADELKETHEPHNATLPEPPVQAKSNEAAKNSKDMYGGDNSESDDPWDSEDELPLSDMDKPAKPVVTKPEVAAKPVIKAEAAKAMKPAVAAKPKVTGGMNAGWSDEESEATENTQSQGKKAEEERLKKWNDDFEKQQEKLRQEAQEELRKEKEEAQRQMREDEEREKKEREERARIEEEKIQERLKEEERQAELKRQEMERREREEKERIERERKELEQKKEQERKELERIAKERRELEEEAERREKERKEQERRELAKVEAEKEELERLEKQKEAERRASLSAPSVNKQPQKLVGPAVPPKPRGVFFPTQAPGDIPPPSARLNDSFDSDDTFNNDQIPDISGPVRPTDAMMGPLGGSNHLPPSGYRPNGTVVNGHSRNDDDNLSYSSTEHDISDHGANPSLGLGNSANLSFGSDSMNMLRQQEQLRETRRLLDKERSTRVSMENKKQHIETERSEILQKLEDVTHAKSNLEQEKIKMEANIRSLDYELGQEEAKRKNAEALFNKMKEQLSRKEEQYAGEVEARQKAELNLRNIQMELRTVLSQVKQLEDEKEDFNRQLQHEKNARLLQEQINEELTSFQKSLTQNKGSDKTEIMSKFEEADDNRKHAQESVEKLQADLYAVKMELERQRNRARDDHNLLTSENEDLVSKIAAMKADLKLNEDALNQATMQYNINLSQMKVENNRVSTNWEKERETKEKLEAEVQSLSARLEAAANELKSTQNARSDLERQNHRNYEDLTKLLEKREQELTNLKENKENLVQKANSAETRLNIQENELRIINATLAERNSQVSTLQQDLEQRKSTYETLDANFRKEKEDNVRLQARMETLQERLTSLQNEVLNLRQQNDDLKTQNIGKDQRETQEKVSSMLQSLRDEHERSRLALEEKNTSLNQTVLQLKDNIKNAENRQGSGDVELRKLQDELKDAYRELTATQASLEVANKTKEHLEMDKKTLQGECERLQNRLETAQQKKADVHTQLLEVTSKLERAEQSSALTNQQLAAMSANGDADARTREEFLNQVHQLEIAKTRLESALEHESDKVNMLQRELHDANQTLDSLQEQVSLLRSSNNELQHQLNSVTAEKTQANNEAHDNKELWEAEVKARSKLGLRDYDMEIAQLEREKQEVLAQVEEEKKRTRKAIDLKKVTEVKLSSEQQKSDQLQKEIDHLKTFLKSAKKKLKASKDSSAVQNVQEQELRDMERTVTALRQQLEETTKQLGMERFKNLELEGGSKRSKNESAREMEKTILRLEKGKRKVEEEYAIYKAHVANNFIEKTKLEMARADLESQARQELNKKIEEVNLYLKDQVETRHAIDKIRDAKEAEMKREFEKTKRDMKDEIYKLKNSYNSTSPRRDDFEMQKYRELYDSEAKLKERLIEKLISAQEKAAQAQLIIERQKLMNSGLGAPFPHSVPPRLSQYNDILGTQLRADLDRSINKHLEKGPKIDISIPNTLGQSTTPNTFEKSAQDYLEVLKSSYNL